MCLKHYSFRPNHLSCVLRKISYEFCHFFSIESSGIVSGWFCSLIPGGGGCYCFVSGYHYNFHFIIMVLVWFGGV